MENIEKMSTSIDDINNLLPFFLKKKDFPIIIVESTILSIYTDRLMNINDIFTLASRR